MREGLLGALQLKFVMVFIFIFLIIIAAGLKYIQAFRVKNRIIDYIEMYEGYCVEKQNANCISNKKINEYVDGISFVKWKNGKKIRLYEVEKVESTSEESYYIVTTKIAFEIPFIGFGTDIKIKGQTKGVYEN